MSIIEYILSIIIFKGIPKFILFLFSSYKHPLFKPMTVKSSNNIIGEPEEPPFVPTEYKK